MSAKQFLQDAKDMYDIAYELAKVGKKKLAFKAIDEAAEHMIFFHNLVRDGKLSSEADRLARQWIRRVDLQFTSNGWMRASTVEQRARQEIGGR